MTLRHACLLGVSRALTAALLTTRIAFAIETVGVEIDASGPRTLSDVSLDARSGGNATGVITRSTAAVTFTSNARVSVYHEGTHTKGVLATAESTVIFPPAAAAVGGGLNVLEIVQPNGLHAIALESDDFASISFRGRGFVDEAGNGDAIFARVFEHSNMHIDGLVAVKESGNGDTIGLLLAGFGETVWTGVFDLYEEGNGDAFLAVVRSSATADFSGVARVVSNGNGDTYGVRTDGSSKVSLSGDVDLRSSIDRDAVLFDLTDQSQVIFDGRIVASANGRFNSGNKDVAPISVSDDAQLSVVGGAIGFESARGRGDVPGGPLPVELHDVELRERARFSWSGGAIDVTSLGLHVAPTFLVADSSILTIAGRDFDRPLGEVLDTKGSISGVLLDGTPFAMNFDRGASATIRLVPELSTAAMMLVFAGLLLIGVRADRS